MKQVFNKYKIPMNIQFNIWKFLVSGELMKVEFSQVLTWIGLGKHETRIIHEDEKMFTQDVYVPHLNPQKKIMVALSDKLSANTKKYQNNYKFISKSCPYTFCKLCRKYHTAQHVHLISEASISKLYCTTFRIYLNRKILN